VIGQSPDAVPGQEEPMHRNHTRRQLLEARAHAMRAAPTWSEQALFRLIGAGQLGVLVRRQVVVGEFVADFAVPSTKLIIEVDGGRHVGRAAADARRDRKLTRLGWRVLRLEAELVLREPEVALARVREALG
jgi:very-short-patch-repair endonuclease